MPSSRGIRRLSLRRGARVAVAIAGLFAAARTGFAAQDAVSPLDALYKEYAANGSDALAGRLRTRADLKPLADLNVKKIRAWLGVWDRAKAAFALDLADVVAPLSQGLEITLLSEGRLYVISRLAPLGAAPAEDDFELTWHKAAMAQLASRMQVATEDIYLDTLERRYTTRRGAASVPLDPRFTLQRGIVQEQRCWQQQSFGASRPPTVIVAPLNSSQEPVPQIPAGLNYLQPEVPTEVPTLKRCLIEGVRRFAAAAGSPETTTEATLRTGWLQFQLGLRADALATIDRVQPGTDQTLDYFESLFRGRILEADGRLPQAEAAYRSAIDVNRSAQSARIGLAATLFRLHRLEEALKEAAGVRALPADSIDPWWTYLGGDARFLPMWMADVRHKAAAR